MKYKYSQYLFIIPILIGIFFSSCNKNTHTQVVSLCRELQELPNQAWKTQIRKIDSIITISKQLSVAEQSILLFQTIRICKVKGKNQEEKHYIKELDSLPFPKIIDKYMGFLLLEQYALNLDVRCKDVIISGLSALLFSMENRFRLTLEERCRFMILKAQIYYFYFNENESALSIINQAAIFVQKHQVYRKYLFYIYELQLSCYIRLKEREKTVSLLHKQQELLDSAEQYGLDEEMQIKIYKCMIRSYVNQKEYEKAYNAWNNLLSLPHQQDKFYNEQYTEILIETNRIQKAVEYLDENEHKISSNKQGKTNRPLYLAVLGNITWGRARIHLRQGDTILYGKCLTQAIGYFDQMPSYNIDIRHCFLSETYARWLWKEERRDDAIERMELVTGKLTKPKSLSIYANNITSDIAKERLQRLVLLTDYYRQVGQFEKAVLQMDLCDSVQNIINTAQNIKSERIYTNELNRNLEFLVVTYQKDRYKLTLIIIFLSFTVMAAAVLIRRYYCRQKELNAIYTRQKEIEQMEIALHALELNQKIDINLPPDKQLYLRLEKQMYEKKLFLNPKFSREDLCRLVGSNRMYVSTSINKYSKMNLNQWINKARINHAIMLISAGETNLSSLAERSGFSSISAFYRNFKEITMLTPTQYIERMITKTK